MDDNIVSQVVSFIALIVSILTMIYTEKSSRASIRADNCGKIFDEYLIDKIPKSRTNLRFGADGKLYNGNELCNTLTSMMMAALFYKYSSSTFYELLGEKCKLLEDSIVEAGNHPKISDYEQKAFWDDLQRELQSIYKMVEDKRIGRSKILTRISTFFRKHRQNGTL